jgi:hypothetical protein
MKAIAKEMPRGGRSFKRWQVVDPSNTVIGMIEKFPDTRTECHPYKVFYLMDPDMDIDTINKIDRFLVDRLIDSRSLFLGFVFKASALALRGTSNHEIVAMEQEPNTKIGGIDTAIKMITDAHEKMKGL